MGSLLAGKGVVLRFAAAAAVSGLGCLATRGGGGTGKLACLAVGGAANKLLTPTPLPRYYSVITALLPAVIITAGGGCSSLTHSPLRLGMAAQRGELQPGLQYCRPPGGDRLRVAEEGVGQDTLRAI